MPKKFLTLSKTQSSGRTAGGRLQPRRTTFSKVSERVDKILTNAVKNKKSDMSKDGVMERSLDRETHLREIKEWVQKQTELRIEYVHESPGL